MKVFELNGDLFEDVEGFYDEIDRLLTKDLTWRTGHNLDAYNDLLRGGFGVHEYGEPIVIRWLNFEKSKRELGADFVQDIIDITTDDRWGHRCTLELC
ncbi:MAG: barstar family protein [Clostridia bacterium]|nr:barstar family protein [Clostridia bacterium]